MKSYQGIPDGYELKYNLDLLKNRSAFLILNVLSIVVIIPFLFGIALFDFGSLDTFTVFFILPLFLVVIIIHEWIHGFFFHRYSGAKVKYQFHGWAFSASTPGIVYLKKYYYIIGLAPAVILNVLLIIGSIILPAPYDLLSYFVLICHVSGCAGDFYVTLTMLKYPKETYIEDTGTGMKFYVKSEPQPLESFD